MSDSAFNLRRLSVLAYAQGFTQWVYDDVAGALAPLCADGFFNPAADMIRARDHIHLTARDGGAILWVQSVSETSGVTVKVMAST